jgi:prevent-host-death family protein
MPKELNALKIRKSLGEILEEVYYRGEEYIIKRGKKPMAVLIPVTEFDSFKKQRQKDMQVFSKIREKAKGIPSKEIEADVEEAVRAARKRA